MKRFIEVFDCEHDSDGYINIDHIVKIEAPEPWKGSNIVLTNGEVVSTSRPVWAVIEQIAEAQV